MGHFAAPNMAFISFAKLPVSLQGADAEVVKSFRPGKFQNHSAESRGNHSQHKLHNVTDKADKLPKVNMPYPMTPATPEVCAKRGGTYKHGLDHEYPWLKGRVCHCHQDPTKSMIPDVGLFLVANMAFVWAQHRGNPEIYPFVATLKQAT